MTFFRLSARKAREDGLLNRSAALAFITVLSLVPLLAGLSYFSVGFFNDRREAMIALLSQVLPYTQATITSSLSTFLEQTQDLRGFGFIAFLLTALTAFSMIEESINDIWDVPRRRSLRSRVNSFFLLLCWGPLLIGASYSALFFLRQSPAFAHVADSMPVRGATFLVTAFGLTMLNQQVPHTAVRFRHALLGGTGSAVAIELLRWGFGFYVEKAQQMSIVYGSFGFALLFMISIQLSWAIVLAGTELAFCLQNFQFMSRPRRQAAMLEGSWIGLAAMVLIMDRFRDHRPSTAGEYLAEHLSLSTADIDKVLEPLLQAEYLQEHEAEPGSYLMSCDPYRVPLIDLMELYEPEQWNILSRLPKGADDRLQTVRARLMDARIRATEGLTLASLMIDADDDASAAPEVKPIDEPKPEPAEPEKTPARTRKKERKTNRG